MDITLTPSSTNWGTTSSNTITLDPNWGTISSDTSTTTVINNFLPINTIMQNKVAIFKVTRDEDNKITSTEFIKELWVETKNGASVDFQVARDKDLIKYEASELVIKVISTISF